MTNSKPRAFVEIRTTGDVWHAMGPVYVPCDAKPAYWLRSQSGDIVPATAQQARQLNRLVGKPRLRRVPIQKRRYNPLRPPQASDF